MADKIDLGPGFPEWTEIGQETGLDPLGMQRPIELVYQSLLPGISTITLRFRYYSFFAWLLEAYAKQDKITTAYEDFRRFQRRTEALYALACARGETELGVAGIDWAFRQLAAIDQAGPDTVVDFSIAADSEAEEKLRYLRNKGGAFGAIYASQMREMGLVKLDDPDLIVPFCKDSALPLASSFQDALGDLAGEFLAAVGAGKVSLDLLDRLACIKPSKIQIGSPEQQHLASILMARQESASASDQTRRKTLLMLLQLARTIDRPPTSEETKWTWFGAETAKGIVLPDSDLRKVWALYQASDLYRLGYEVLLHACLRILRNAPRGRLALPSVVADLLELADMPSGVTLGDWMLEQTDGDSLENRARTAAQTMRCAHSSGNSQEEVRSALMLISALTLKASEFDRSVLQWLGAAGHFQSLASETKFLEGRLDLPVTEAVSGLVRERILGRHLWVASRKFRNQKAYTFLFEPDEGELRYRSFFRVSPSSPRIDQAVQFLRDIKYLDDKGITALGLKELEQA
ncbi:hypothetical protein AU381_16795 [Sinorhizobium glycinis]|uniref:Uncharacterized protein n=1 Tax=Sinorhizobium glycinis TaxID=1472378 RepID=A0A178XKR6_9HYPH|nr:hypothetical protein [Sinorhizobium glycinis]OAP35839.1 hypothetical protein AU381_16795 [Sinorhizobium glycinis]